MASSRFFSRFSSIVLTGASITIQAGILTANRNLGNKKSKDTVAGESENKNLSEGLRAAGPKPGG